MAKAFQLSLLHVPCLASPHQFPCTWTDTWPHHLDSLMVFVHSNIYLTLRSPQLSWLSHSRQPVCPPRFTMVWVPASHSAQSSLPGAISGTTTALSHSRAELTNRVGSVAFLLLLRGTEGVTSAVALRTLVSLVP